MKIKKRRNKTIAIPRALWYYIYPGLWEEFFNQLGFQVHVSGQTVRKTVESGTMISESEHCLPLKLHDAHLEEAAEIADTLFIPRILSSLPGHIACPKLGALPDCAKAVFGKSLDIITVDVDENKTKLTKSLMRLGKKLGFRGAMLKDAAERSIRKMETLKARREFSGDLNAGFFLLIGHPYNLCDSYISGPVLSKLDSMKEPWCFLDLAGERASPELMKWDACSIMYKALSCADKDKCKGVIQLSSFNCGCDSVSMEIFRRLLREKKIPYMALVMDEHEGRAGLDTRLEAFVDSIRWKKW